MCGGGGGSGRGSEEDWDDLSGVLRFQCGNAKNAQREGLKEDFTATSKVNK